MLDLNVDSFEKRRGRETSEDVNVCFCMEECDVRERKKEGGDMSRRLVWAGKMDEYGGEGYKKRRTKRCVVDVSMNTPDYFVGKSSWVSLAGADGALDTC